MKIELKPFQDQAARELLQKIARARRDVHDGEAQAVILSSPTGSGKTVITTQLLEWIWQGDEEKLGDKKAVFLWLSDSPELNEQSRDKLIRQSSVFPENDLVIIEPLFSQKQLEPGKIYFLNTQKLSKSSLLTKTSDGRDYTIWQTIENTVKAGPEHVYLVIDEAHRGTKEGRIRKEAASIMQRFVKGYPEGGMNAVPLIIGMSATPERFERLVEGTSRVKRPVTINAEDVRQSGLLKERIVLFHPTETQPADWSLLEEATRRWQKYRSEWKKYCSEQKLDMVVEPVLVLQVEDGTERQLTKTNLEDIIRVVERIAGKLPDAAWAHAFQEDAGVKIGEREIRKIDPSKIESDGVVQVVLFKMSLSTGWDCPRAEVMMSFRRAVDATLIAQLIGRMVRTPLARKVEGNEVLNSVALFLPHYDEQGVRTIIDRLSHPDPEEGMTIDVVHGDDLMTVMIDKGRQDCIDFYQKLPSYAVERIPKASDIKRLVRFARYLANDEVDAAELDRTRSFVVTLLEKEITRLKKNKKFIGNMEANEEIEIAETWIDYGGIESQDSRSVKIRATEENLEDLFSRCGRSLGEGLHMEYWRMQKDLGPLKSKLELIGLLMEENIIEDLEKECKQRLHALWRKHDASIRSLSTSDQEKYNVLKRIAKEPEPMTLLLPAEMELKREGKPWKKHLYVTKENNFEAKLNTWETRVVEELIEDDKSVKAWLRIIPRKDWALCIPYEKHNEKHPLYPDIVTFRQTKTGLVADILDPHGTQLDDAVDKAKGLAAYARKHGSDYGRIELIIVNEKDKLRRLNLNDESVRERVDMVTSREHLVLLLNELS